jgi:hypothetical protein
MPKQSGITIAISAMAVLRINIFAGLSRRKRGSIPRSLPCSPIGAAAHTGYSGKQMNGQLISVATDRTAPISRGQLALAASKSTGQPVTARLRSIERISITQINTYHPRHLFSRGKPIARWRLQRS